MYIFPTRSECNLTSSPLVSSVTWRLLHSFRVYFFNFTNSLNSASCLLSSVLWASVEESLTWSDTRSEDMQNYTRNEWRRCETTLETGGEVVKLHSKRVEEMWNYTPNEWRSCKTTLETSEKVVIVNSKLKHTQKYYLVKYNKRIYTSPPLDLNVNLHLLHSFRV